MNHNEEHIHVVPGENPSSVRNDEASSLRGDDSMVTMARENERFHLASAPGASHPLPNPFPPMLFWGLAGGMVSGSVVGLVFGLLLLNRTLVFANWEQLYSMTPGTFGMFWTGIGIAVGALVGGLVTILVADAMAPEDS
jgi:hypothetical protein